MENIQSLINELRLLDLSKQPLDKINDLFRKAGTIGYIGVKFHPGKKFSGQGLMIMMTISFPNVN